MNSEIQAASSFLSTFLPPSTSNNFIQILHTLLLNRYNSHWHPNDPERGSAYRALVRSGSTLDATLISAAAQCGINSYELQRALGSAEGKIWLGKGWTLWVDPGCVSLRIEKNGVVGGGVGQGREGQFIEIYGKLPESLSSHAVLLENVDGPKTINSSVNILTPLSSHSTTTPTFASRDLPIPSSISPPTQDYSLLSPNTKRSSRAIQITRPPIMENRPSSFSVRPTSPLSHNSSEMLLPSFSNIFASPRVTPPTPARPIGPSNLDVFSPSPKPSSSSSASNLTLSAPDPRSQHQHRRSTSIGSISSASSIGSRRCSGSASGSDAEDGIFSSSESMSSSFTSAGTGAARMWAGHNAANKGGSGNFAFPTNGNDSFNPSHQQQQQYSQNGLQPRSHSSLSNRSQHSSPTKSGSNYPRSTPSSPTKPRRRGARGGSVSLSNSSALSLFPTTSGSHEHSSSITSISSITSSTTRTREQALLGTLTEHSGGKVGVLGGGVLLGLAAGAKAAGAKMAGAHGNREGETGGRRRNASGGSAGSRRRIQPVSVPFPTTGNPNVGGYGMF